MTARQTICAVLTLTLASALGAAAGAQPLRVHVSTAQGTSGFVDPVLIARQEAIAALKSELGKKKIFTVVSETSEADIHLEVLARSAETRQAPDGRKDAGREETTPTGGGATRTRKAKDHVVHVALTVGDYRLEFEGVDERSLSRETALGTAI